MQKSSYVIFLWLGQQYLLFSTVLSTYVYHFYSRNSLGISRSLQPGITHLSIQIVAWGQSPELPEIPIWIVSGTISHDLPGTNHALL